MAGAAVQVQTAAARCRAALGGAVSAAPRLADVVRRADEPRRGAVVRQLRGATVDWCARRLRVARHLRVCGKTAAADPCTALSLSVHHARATGTERGMVASS